MKQTLKKCLLAGAALMAVTPMIATDATEWDTWSDTWVAVDDLGRDVATSDFGVTRKEKDPDTTVGMFYYIWHGQENSCGKDISVLLQENPDNPKWGPEKAFHWGSKPWLGYYNAGDPYIVERHIQMLCDAGVDFLFFDCTNAKGYFPQVQAVLDECIRRDNLGLAYPQLCFMLHASPITALLTAIYNRFYKTPAYDKYWFRYDGKPLVLAKRDEVTKADLKSYFTFRDSWAWMRGASPDCWAWLEFYPQAPGWSLVYDPQQQSTVKVQEQISVSVAQHATSKVGKSYSGGRQPAIDKYGQCEETPYGRYFQEQWTQAIKLHLPIVMVTQFNEWIAQRFVITSSSQFGDVRPGATAKIGESYFVDVYSPEFSRDLEPSAHPSVRDNYYLQLVSNTRKYRGVNKIPVPTQSLSIDIAGPFEQWDAETVEYRDDRCDTIRRNPFESLPEEIFQRRTNDIVRAKVTKDADNYYFYVETLDPISPFDEATNSWMRLYLNTTGEYTDGWCGYSYIVAKNMSTGKYMLHKPMRNGKWGWTPVEEVQFRVEGNRMHVAVPRVSVMHNGYEADIDFKWSDNTAREISDIMQFISEGDAAPNGRFNYRYKGSKIKGVGALSDVLADRCAVTKLTPGPDALTIDFQNNPDSVAVNVYAPNGSLVQQAYSGGRTTMRIPLRGGMYIVNWQSPRDSGSQSVVIR